MSLDRSSFGGRILERGLQLPCPYCGARRGHECRTRPSRLPAPMHAARWEEAKRKLLAEGDGPDNPHLRSVP